MSHFTTIKVEADQKNEKQFIAALEEHFGEGNVEVHEDGEWLKTYAGQSTQTAKHLGETNKCHIIIRKKTLEKKLGHDCATNDAGYERTADGKYRAYIDAAGFSTKLQGLVAQSYTLAVSEKKLKAEGYITKRVNKADGVVRLEARLF